MGPAASRGTLRRRLARSTRTLRAARGWTQEEAAEAAGLYSRHYRKVEAGQVNVTIDTIERLCRALPWTRPSCSSPEMRFASLPCAAPSVANDDLRAIIQP